MQADTLPADWIPALQRPFRLQWEEAQQCHVLLYPEGMVKLNLSAGEILKRADGQRRLQQIIEELTTAFPQAGDIRADIREFLAEACDKGWVQAP